MTLLNGFTQFLIDCVTRDHLVSVIWCNGYGKIRSRHPTSVFASLLQIKRKNTDAWLYVGKQSLKDCLYIFWSLMWKKKKKPILQFGWFDSFALAAATQQQKVPIFYSKERSSILEDISSRCIEKFANDTFYMISIRLFGKKAAFSLRLTLKNIARS